LHFTVFASLILTLASRALGDMPHPLLITCHRDSDFCNVPLLAFVPCKTTSSAERSKIITNYNSEESSEGECDPLVWAAIQLAVEDVNRNGSGVWKNGRWENVSVKLHLMDIVTQVCTHRCG